MSTYSLLFSAALTLLLANQYQKLKETREFYHRLELLRLQLLAEPKETITKSCPWQTPDHCRLKVLIKSGNAKQDVCQLRLRDPHWRPKRYWWIEAICEFKQIGISLPIKFVFKR